MREDALLDLLLTTKEEWVMDVKVGGSLRCSDHESMKFKILREGNNAKPSITTLDFRRTEFGIFRDLFGSPQETVLERGGIQKHCMIFQGSPPPNSRMAHPNKSGIKQRQQEACTDEQGAPN
ncbi:hypothetical protein GRJ2_000837000 [Grus japonensis]|uniref:Uncharacterized protein n=1 Tax=Grus japonensis TaxID=30415 RepID=A0ABC9WGC2_GRUJA